MSTRGFLIEILVHKYNVQQICNPCFFIHFYYSRIMITFSQSQFLLFPVQPFFNDCDVRTLKIIHPMTFRNNKKHQIKVCKIKITSCKHATFLENGSRTPSGYFCTECIWQEKPSWDTMTYILYLDLNRAKKCFFKKMQLGY